MRRVCTYARRPMNKSFMRILLIALSLCALAAQAAPMDNQRAEALCGKFFKGDKWHASHDAEVKSQSAEFLAKANIRAIPIVCIGAPDSTDTAASRTFSDGFDEYFFIALNADFRLSIGDELRAIVAHEVAHLVTNRGVHCNDRGSKDAYELCESAADKQADNWAGKGSMARSLGWTARYLAERNGGNDVTFIETIRSVRRRIFLLR